MFVNSFRSPVLDATFAENWLTGNATSLTAATRVSNGDKSLMRCWLQGRSQATAGVFQTGSL